MAEIILEPWFPSGIIEEMESRSPNGLSRRLTGPGELTAVRVSPYIRLTSKGAGI